MAAAPTLLLLLFLLSLSPAARVKSHEESGPWTCESSEISIEAEFNPGIVTLDGHADDWDSVEGSEFSLLPALDPDEDKAYEGGKMTVKVRTSNYPLIRSVKCLVTQLICSFGCDCSSCRVILVDLWLPGLCNERLFLKVSVALEEIA